MWTFQSVKHEPHNNSFTLKFMDYLDKTTTYLKNPFH